MGLPIRADGREFHMSANPPAKPETVETGTVVKRSDYEEFVAYLRDRAAIEGSLAVQKLNEEQFQRILAAKTEDELEEAMELLGLTGLKEIENGTVIQINEFHLMPGTRSEFQNRLGVFAVIDVTLLSDSKLGKTGTNLMMDTGIDRIIVWLRAIESGQIPGTSFPLQRIVAKVGAASGDMVTLKRLPKPLVKGESAPF